MQIKCRPRRYHPEGKLFDVVFDYVLLPHDYYCKDTRTSC